MNFKYSVFNPRLWFATDKEKKIARANRHYYGESLERALCDLEFDPQTTEHKKQTLLIDKKYNRISDYEYWVESIKLKYEDANSQECLLALLELDRVQKNIPSEEYEKKKQTIKKEPYIAVVEMSFDPNKPSNGYFELDWNEYFVQQLKDAGYVGQTDDLVVKQWFDTLCCEIAKENGATFNELSPHIRRNPKNDGKTEIL